MWSHVKSRLIKLSARKKYQCKPATPKYEPPLKSILKHSPSQKKTPLFKKKHRQHNAQSQHNDELKRYSPLPITFKGNARTKRFKLVRFNCQPEIGMDIPSSTFIKKSNYTGRARYKHFITELPSNSVLWLIASGILLLLSGLALFILMSTSPQSVGFFFSAIALTANGVLIMKMLCGLTCATGVFYAELHFFKPELSENQSSAPSTFNLGMSA